MKSQMFLVLLSFVVSCGKSSFNGGGSSNNPQTNDQSQNPQTPVSAQPSQPTQNPVPLDPNTGTPLSPTNTTSTIPWVNGPAAPITPAGGAPGYPGFYNPQNPQAANPPATIQPVPSNNILTPTPNQIVFNDVFHIGDKNYSASSCKKYIDQIKFNGAAFFFNFKVVNSGTMVNLSVQKFCGIDNNTSNFVSIANVLSKQIFYNAPLFTSYNLRQLVYQNKSLDAGDYSIVIDSLPNAMNPQYPIGDRDDFTVGVVALNASGPITNPSIGSIPLPGQSL